MAKWTNSRSKLFLTQDGDPRLLVISGGPNGVQIREAVMVTAKSYEAGILVSSAENTVQKAKARAERHAAKKFGWEVKK